MVRTIRKPRRLILVVLVLLLVILENAIASSSVQPSRYRSSAVSISSFPDKSAAVKHHHQQSIRKAQTANDDDDDTAPTASPTAPPSSSQSVRGRSFFPFNALSWSLLLPIVSISIMAWAFGRNARRCSACCGDCMDNVPDEIVVRRKKKNHHHHHHPRPLTKQQQDQVQQQHDETINDANRSTAEDVSSPVGCGVMGFHTRADIELMPVPDRHVVGTPPPSTPRPFSVTDDGRHVVDSLALKRNDDDYWDENSITDYIRA